jgi:hypothetical protein
VDVATYGIKIDANGAIVGLQQLDRQLRGTETQVGKLDRAKKGLEATAKRVGTVLGLGMAASLYAFVRNTSEAQKVQAQLGAALRSTGGAAGQTIEGLNAHAAALQKVTTFGDEAINTAQGVLLTFTQIRGPQFTRATEAVLDMAQALGMDLQGASIQVGKALNDPILGVTALGRAGVQFSVAQKAMIKEMVETNRLAEAQGVILKELETQFGGSAAAARNTLGGAIAALKNVIGDLFEFDVDQTSGIVGAINALTEKVPALRRMLDELLNSWSILFVDIELSVAKLDARLAKSNVAVYSFIVGASKGVLGAKGLAEEMGRLANAEIDIANLEALKLERQRAILGITNKQTEAIKQQTAALHGLARATSRSIGGIGGTSERVGGMNTGGVTSLPAGVGGAGVVQALPWWRILSMEMDKAGEDIAKNFREQMQISLGRFFADFFRNGLSSIRGFWESFKNLAFDVLGQLASRAVMNAIGDRMPKSFGGGIAGTIAGGIGVGVFASVIDGMLNAGKAAQQMAAAMADSARNIEQFARFATDRDLTDLQRQRRDMTEQRDALARQAVGAAGISGFSGNYDEAIEAAENFLRLTGNKRYEELIRQLRTLGKAYEANIDSLTRAMKEAGEAAARAAAAEKLLSLQRTIGSLESFRRDIRSSNLSIYSPFQQLDDARARYESLVAAARGGDQSAADQLPAAARAFLEQSRSINASGARYVADFQRVESDTAFIMERFERQADEQRAILDETVAQTGILTAMRFQLERTDPYLEAQVTLQQEIARGIVEMREAIVEELRGVSREIRVFTGLGNEPILIAGG